MTPQQVIQNFMAKLVDHGQSYSDSIGTAMLNSAVQSSSEFSGVQAVIDAMKADQIKAEKEAVEEILGSEYAGKTLSEIPSNILSANAKDYDTKNLGNAYLNSWNDNRTTVERLLKERKAFIFLEKYCGIQLAKKYWITSSDTVTYWSSGTSGNVDTGAITGSDANITLTAGETLNGKTLTAANLKTLKTKYDSAATLSSDEKTIVIGTGKEKTDRSVVPEFGNKYTATTSQAQKINTGSNDWLVVATSGNDTITTGGADSVNAGAGNDKIIVGADYATILTGAGSDSVEISAAVKNVTLGDLNSSDVIKISGTFEVGSAKIEDTLLVITDKTGTRKIRLGDFDTAKNAKINSTTIGTWLTNAGIDLNNLQSTSSNKSNIDTSNWQVSRSENDFVNDGDNQTAIDPDYTPTPIPKTTASEQNQDLPQRSSNSTGEINVNLDNVSLTGGDLNLDGNKVGEISNEFPNVNSFTKNGLTINLVGTTSNTDGYPNNFTNQTFDQLTDDQKTIVAGLFKWWGKECLKLNEQSYGIGFNSSTAKVKEIGLYFYDGNGSSNTLAAVWNWSDSKTGQNAKLMLTVNMDYYKNIAEDNFDGQSSKSSAGLLDRTLAHEFTHAIMATNINYFNSLPKFIKEGMAELTHGIDDFRPTNIFKIAYDADWLDASLDLGNKGTGSQSIGDGYSGGYMFLRYLAKQSALQSIVDELKTNPLLITLTEGNDTYSNTLAGATILALGGDDSIINGKINNTLASNVSIDAGAGKDHIENYGNNVAISGGEGDDTISNYGSKVTVDGGAGKDYIFNNNLNTKISGGAGDDYIDTDGPYSTVDGGEGDDTIITFGSNVTVNGGTGNDQISLQNDSSKNFIQYKNGDGNDLIQGFNATSSLKIGNGTTDTYFKFTVGSDILVSVGSGVITLKGAASLSSVKILGKEIISSVNPLLITLTEGNDSYSNSLVGATIKALGGNDTIYNGLAKYSTVPFGSSTVVSYGKSSVSVDAGDGDDLISLYGGAYSTIFGGAGKDSILNGTVAGGVLRYGASYVTLSGGADDDYIYSIAENISIDGGAGNDRLINSWGENVTINGGAGNDSITSNKINSLVRGGTGNDSVNGSSYIYEYADGDGNDTISSGVIAVNITKGTVSSSFVSGNNFILKIGSGSITIRDGAKKNIPVVYGDYSEYWRDKRIYNSKQNTIVSGGDNADSIHNRVSNVTIKAGKGRDTVLNENWNGSSWNAKTPDNVFIDGEDGDDVLKNDDGAQATIFGGTGDDKITNSGSKSFISGGTGDDTITNRIHSVVSVNESNMGEKKVTSGSDSTIDGGAGNDSISNLTNNTSVNGGEGNDTIVNDVQTYLNLTTTDGVAFNGSDTTQYFGLNSTLNGGAGNDYIVSKTSDTTLIGGTGNDTISLVNTNSSIKADKNVILYSSGDGNDLIQGFNATSSLKIGNGTSDTYSKKTVGSDVLVSVGSGVITLKGAASLSSVKILGKEVSASVNPLLITLTEGKDTYNNSLKGATILALGGDDYIYNSYGSDSVTIDGGKGNDYIYNDGLNVSIDGGEGKDTIDNWRGNVTIKAGDGDDSIRTVNNGNISISGGAGSDTISLLTSFDSLTLNGGTGDDIIYGEMQNTTHILYQYAKNDGNDVIHAFKNTDMLQIGGGTGTYSTQTSGNDVLVKVGNNTITLKNAYISADTLHINGDTIKLERKKNITLTAADEIVYVGVSSISVNTGAGNDSIYSHASNVSIDGDAGNDYIYNPTSNVTIDGGAGNDNIYNSGSNVTINTGAGNDYIHNSGSNVTISGGAGNDEINLSSYYKNNVIQYTSGDGNDVIYGFNETSSLKIGNGSTDTYSKKTVDSDVLVSVGSGVITLKGAASLSSINILGKEVSASVNPLLITLTEGNDSYSNSLTGATIKALGGNDSIINGKDSTTLASNVSINAGDGNDTIYNYGENVSIDVGAGNDYVHNTWGGSLGGRNVTVLGGAGNDTITGAYLGNSDHVKLDGGDGDDYIYDGSWGGSGNLYLSVDGGSGNDTIETHGGLILGGAGDDVITKHHSANATINGGTGNDRISLQSDSSKNLIQYENGDDNDSVFGFKANDTLQIGNGTSDTYSSIKSGSDVVISVGEGAVTLKGAASLSAVNVAGKYVGNSSSSNRWEFADGQVSYIVDDEILFTIYNISSTAKESDFKLSGTTVTISKNALGDDDVFLEGEGYTLTLANDVPKSPKITNGGWSALVNGKATYKATAYSAYYTIEDNTIIYTAEEGGEQFTLSGIKSIASSAVQIDAENKIVTLFKTALGTNKVTLEGDDYSLALDSNIVQEPGVNERKFTALTNGTATYKIFGDKEYYTLDGNEVFYTPATNDKTFTISGLASNLNLNNGKIAGVAAYVNETDKSVKFTLSATALKNSDVTLSGTGATLELSSDVPQTAKNIPEAWSVDNGTASYRTNGKSEYYTLSNGKVNYHAAVGGDLQIKLSGITAQAVNGKINGITLSGKSLTISSAVGKNVALQYNNGFNVNLSSNIKNISFTGTSGVDSITNNGSNISLDGAAGNDYIRNYGNLATINAGDGNDTVCLNFNGTGDSVSVSGGAGNDSIVNNSAYYITMNGGAGNDTFSSNGNYVSINGGEGTDNISNTGSYVTINGGAGNDFIFNNATSLVTINTAEGNDTIQLGSSVKSLKVENFGAGDVIQLSASATKLETINGGIKAGNVTVSGVTNIATVKNSWSTSTNSISYNQSTVAGAKLNGSKIIYDTLGSTENLFTISGIKSTTGVALSLESKEITLNNAALKNSTGKVSISSGNDYILKLASDVDTIAENNSGWTTLTGGNVAYLEGGKGSYYSISDDGKSVTYNAQVAGKNKVEFGGVKGTPTISGKTVSLTANNFNGNVSVASNAGNYQFALSGSFGGKKFTGTAKADKISNSGSNISIDGGAGNDTFTNSGSNVTITGGKGNDVFAHSSGNFKITDYTASADKVSLNIAQVQDVSLNNKDVTLNLGASDAITITSGKDKKITVSKPKTAQYIFGDHVIFNAGKTSSSLTSAATTFTAISSVATVDATKTNSAVQVVGNAKANKISAGAKGSTLNGGKGNDTLIGGAGIDIFVYANKTGNDVIQNYTSGKDKISLSGGASIKGLSVNTSGDAVLKIGSNNLTLKKSANENIAANGKKITVIDAAGKETTSTYFTNRTVSGNGVTLNAEYTNSFTASSAIVSVDATSNENPLVLNGNSKNNVLTGGSGKDSLNGGTGNDTLVGGKGNDVLTGGKGADTFVYNKGDGNDKILDYENEDELQIVGDSVSKITKSGKDYVITLASKNKITLVGAADKVISYTDDKNPLGATYPKVLETNSAGTAVTLLSAYSADTFDVNTYADFGRIKTIDASAVDQDLSIIGNKKNNVIIGADGDNTIEGGKGNDTITGGSGKNVFVFKPGDGSDVITNYKGSDIIQAISGTITGSVKGTDVVLSITGGGKVTLQGASKKYVRVTDDNGSHWFFPKSLPKVLYRDQNVSLLSGYTSDTFDVNDFESDFAGKVFDIDASGVKHSMTIIGNKEENEIIGTDSNDYIEGGSGRDYLYGGNGNDTLDGGKGNDTLTGGKGNDLFIYSEGNDVIADYAKGDKISIGAAISKSTLRGSDAVFTLAKNTLTVKNGKGKEIVFTDAKGKSRTIIGGAKLITDSTSAKTTLASGVAVADASTRTKAINITGNALANTILGGSSKDILDGGKGNDYLVGNAGNDSIFGGSGNDKLFGGSGNDSLWGGAGNDTLTGGTGADKFIYRPGEGNDTITDYKYADGDLLQILKSDGKAGSFGQVTFKNDTLTLAINGGGKVSFTGVAAGDSFNINGKSYTLNGGKLK